MSQHKDASYYEAAIQYNKSIRDHCNQLAKQLGHPKVKRWAMSVAQQHHEHIKAHEKALFRVKRDEKNGVVRAYPDGKCAPWCTGGHPVYEREETTEHVIEKSFADQQAEYAASLNTNENNEENTHDAG